VAAYNATKTFLSFILIVIMIIVIIIIIIIIIIIMNYLENKIMSLI